VTGWSVCYCYYSADYYSSIHLDLLHGYRAEGVPRQAGPPKQAGRLAPYPDEAMSINSEVPQPIPYDKDGDYSPGSPLGRAPHGKRSPAR